MSETSSPSASSWSADAGISRVFTPSPTPSSTGAEEGKEKQNQGEELIERIGTTLELMDRGHMDLGFTEYHTCLVQTAYFAQEVSKRCDTQADELRVVRENEVMLEARLEQQEERIQDLMLSLEAAGVHAPPKTGVSSDVAKLIAKVHGLKEHVDAVEKKLNNMEQTILRTHQKSGTRKQPHATKGKHKKLQSETSITGDTLPTTSVQLMDTGAGDDTIDNSLETKSNITTCWQSKSDASASGEGVRISAPSLETPEIDVHSEGSRQFINLSAATAKKPTPCGSCSGATIGNISPFSDEKSLSNVYPIRKSNLSQPRSSGRSLAGSRERGNSSFKSREDSKTKKEEGSLKVLLNLDLLQQQEDMVQVMKEHEKQIQYLTDGVTQGNVECEDKFNAMGDKLLEIKTENEQRFALLEQNNSIMFEIKGQLEKVVGCISDFHHTTDKLGHALSDHHRVLLYLTSVEQATSGTSRKLLRRETRRCISCRNEAFALDDRAPNIPPLPAVRPKYPQGVDRQRLVAAMRQKRFGTPSYVGDEVDAESQPLGNNTHHHHVAITSFRTSQQERHIMDAAHAYKLLINSDHRT